MHKAESLGLDAERIEYAALHGLLRAAQGKGPSPIVAMDMAVEGEPTGPDLRRVVALESEALVRIWSGAPDAALAKLEQATGIAERRGDLLRLYLHLGLRGAALLAAGRAEEAGRTLEQAIGMANRIATSVLLPLFAAWRVEAEAMAGSGSAERCCDAHRGAAAANRPWAASVAARALARACLQAGGYEAARTAIHWAIGTQTGLGLACEVERTAGVLHEVSDIEGRAA